MKRVAEITTPRAIPLGASEGEAGGPLETPHGGPLAQAREERS